MIEAQRLRNLTTGRLHTDIGHVYQDLEFITGEKGLMTHMLPNVMRAVEPWLKEQVTDEKFWDGEFDTDHSGEEFLRPMSEKERVEFFKRYEALPSPFERMASA
jgi:hypothetical protein